LYFGGDAAWILFNGISTADEIAQPAEAASTATATASDADAADDEEEEDADFARSLTAGSLAAVSVMYL